MAVRHNNAGEDGTGIHPYAEIDFTHNSEDYIVRVTANPPYRTVGDELNCHLDWKRISDGRARRYENVTLPAKLVADNGQRRHSLLRHFQAVRGSNTSVPSPVTNWP